MARFELATLCLQGRCNNHYATPAFLLKELFRLTNVTKLSMVLSIQKKTVQYSNASMAEWSKAVDLSSILRCRRGFEPHSRHIFFYSKKLGCFDVGFEPTVLRFCIVIQVCITEQRSGAAEARWAHNPKVGGSKPPFANFVYTLDNFFLKKKYIHPESNRGPTAC